METSKKTQYDAENDILFSKTIKAGMRIYYIDVKKNKKGEMYICVTESKKNTSVSSDMPQTTFEKHKIFLFQEDFCKFKQSIDEAIHFVANRQGEVPQREEKEDEIKIDLEF